MLHSGMNTIVLLFREYNLHFFGLAVSKTEEYYERCIYLIIFTSPYKKNDWIQVSSFQMAMDSCLSGIKELLWYMYIFYHEIFSAQDDIFLIFLNFFLPFNCRHLLLFHSLWLGHRSWRLHLKYKRITMVFYFFYPEILSFLFRIFSIRRDL